MNNEHLCLTRLLVLVACVMGAFGGVARSAPEEASIYSAERIAADRHAPETANRDYRLLSPATIESGRTYPLVIYLHGAGSKGSDNALPLKEAPPKLLATEVLRRRFPCFVLVPQCKDGNDTTGGPNNWVKWKGQAENPPDKWEVSESEPSEQLQGAMAALDDVLARHPVDQTRIYLTGISMGGAGSWYWSAREPRRFAAIVVACGLSETTKAKALAKAKLPIWAFHGSDDPKVPVDRTRKMVAELKAAGGVVRMTEYSGVGHSIGSRVFTQNDFEVFAWLFEQSRK